MCYPRRKLKPKPLGFLVEGDIMSLMSKQEALRAKAQQEGAAEVDVLRAALLESQERYNEQAANIALTLSKYEKRIEALEGAVSASNKQRAVDVSAALEKAAGEILEGVGGKVAKYAAEIEAATDKLRVVKEEKAQNDRLENIKWGAIIFGFVVGGFAIGGYIANLAWGWWYDVPQQMQDITDKINAVNNGMWQLLHK